MHNDISEENSHIIVIENDFYLLVRLNDGSELIGNSNAGVVEVYKNDQWQLICDDGWDDADAGKEKIPRGSMDKTFTNIIICSSLCRGPEWGKRMQ